MCFNGSSGGREGGGGSTSGGSSRDRGQQVVDISRNLVEDARSNVRSAGDDSDSDRKAAATRRAASRSSAPKTSPRPPARPPSISRTTGDDDSDRKAAATRRATKPDDSDRKAAATRRATKPDDSDRKAAATRRAVSRPEPSPDRGRAVTEISEALTRGAERARPLSFGAEPSISPAEPSISPPAAPQEDLSFDLGEPETFTLAQSRFDLNDEDIFGDLALENMPYGATPTPEQERMVREAARKAGVDEDLFARLVGQESAYRPDVWSGQERSKAGAIGPAQLMPGTASDLGVDPYDVEENLLGGARYLRQQLDRFGDPELALAAYNAGPGRVEDYGGVPPFEETQNYVQSILGGRSGQGAMFAGEEPVDGSIRPAARPDYLVAEQALRRRGTPTQQGGIAGMLGMGLGPQGTATYQNLSPTEKGFVTGIGMVSPFMNFATGIGYRMNDREMRAAADMLAGEYMPRKGILGLGLGQDPEFVRVEPVVNELTGETVGAMGYDAEGNPVLYRGQRQGVRYSGPGSEMVEVERQTPRPGEEDTLSAPGGGTRDTALSEPPASEEDEEYRPPDLGPWPSRPPVQPYVPGELSPYTPSQGQGLEALLPYPYGRPTGLSRLQI